MDYKLELLCVPVGNVDAAKEFYVEKAGFVADHDQRVNESLRFVQLTPPGSGCSICIGEGLTTMTPGSLEGLQLVATAFAHKHHVYVSLRRSASRTFAGTLAFSGGSSSRPSQRSGSAMTRCASRA